MLQNLFRTTLRYLWRDRFFSALHVAGLAVGMAAAALMFLWVQDEWTYDRHYRSGDRVYRVLTNWRFGEQREWVSNTPAPLKDEALPVTPGLERLVRTQNLGEVTFILNADKIPLSHVFIAEAGFFDLFDADFLEGNPQTALAQPANIVLTASAATRIFGRVPPLGSTLRLSGKGDYMVSAVVADPPGNSTLRYDALIPWDNNALKFSNNPSGTFRWGQINFGTWALLRPNADPGAIAGRFSEIAAQYRKGDDAFYFSLQRLHDIHLYSGFLRWNTGLSNLASIRLVALIGLLSLVVACINYVNLSSARVRARARSVGIRQTIGARKFHLLLQAMFESGLTVSAALLLAGLLAAGALPEFEKLGGKTFHPEQLLQAPALPIFLCTALVAWLLSGIQPALQVTRFKPVGAMKGEAPGTGKSWLRRSLVVTQFVFSIGLGICSLVIYAQLKYVREKALGFDREHAFMVFVGDSPMAMKNELLNQPGVLGACLCDNPFVQLGSQCSGDNWEGKKDNQASDLWQINVDSDFPALFGLHLREGRWFQPGNCDSLSFVINESAEKMMQLQDPIGKWIEHGGHRGRIVGVARDFHFQSLHSAIEPMIFSQDPKWYRVLHVKTNGENAAQAIATTQQAFQRHFPNQVFKYEFLDEQYDNLYRAESRSGRLAGLFTVLSLFISCLGLFGLAAFAAVQRTKEIGIRKVLGATATGIAAMLTKDFLMLVALAFAVSAPAAYYFMNRWLADFAYHVDLGWQFFALSALIAVLATVLTVGSQALKAAWSDPVRSLRHE